MREVRSCSELRMSGDGRTLVGYAAVFNQETQIGDARCGFREVVAPGAFKDSLASDDCRALWNHDSACVLGRKSAGSLRMVEDDHGLRVEIDLPETQCGRDVAALVKRGDVTGMSFGFETKRDEWNSDRTVRTLRACRLFDVSPVTYPAYEGTDVALRSRDLHLRETEASACRARLQLRRRVYLRHHRKEF